MIPTGRAFYKMSGSGNDFVMVDARSEAPGRLAEPAVIERICARGTGVGADGIVFLESSSHAAVKLVYLNSDGSPADFCGNATLCTVRLATELGAAGTGDFTIETDSGAVGARLRDGLPEIDLPEVTQIQESTPAILQSAGEARIGFALVGVPHLVVLCDDASTVDLVGRGRELRRHASLAAGANVNFVSPAHAASRAKSKGAWQVRTYERGVEGETLACGSGAVATAILLTEWGSASGPVELEMKSGRVLEVRLDRSSTGWKPSLAGEGRVVYKGILSEI